MKTQSEIQMENVTELLNLIKKILIYQLFRWLTVKW